MLRERILENMLEESVILETMNGELNAALETVFHHCESMELSEYPGEFQSMCHSLAGHSMRTLRSYQTRPGDSEFWVFLCVSLGLVCIAGLMAGLTLVR